MSEFAEPFSARVITGLLGLDSQLWPQVADLATKLGYVFSVTIKEDLPVIEEGLLGILDISEKLIQSRRGTDKDDFIGTLVKASIDDKQITEEELLSLVSLLIFAGFDTTRNQIGLGIQTFSKYPEQWKLLGKNSELARAAVEEVMRVNQLLPGCHVKHQLTLNIRIWQLKLAPQFTSSQFLLAVTQENLKVMILILRQIVRHTLALVAECTTALAIMLPGLI